MPAELRRNLTRPKQSVHIGYAADISKEVADWASQLGGLATSCGFSARVLTGAEVSVSSVKSALCNAAKTCADAGGGDFFVTFNGHGGKGGRGEAEQRTEDDCEYRDPQIEQWLMPGGDLADHEILKLLKIASASSRVFVIPDNCFGAGIPPAPASLLRYLTRATLALSNALFGGAIVSLAPGREWEDGTSITPAFVEAMRTRPASFALLREKTAALSRDKVCVRAYGRGGDEFKATGLPSFFGY